jgi:hypothetical protein
VVEKVINLEGIDFQQWFTLAFEAVWKKHLGARHGAHVRVGAVDVHCAVHAKTCPYIGVWISAASIERECVRLEVHRRSLPKNDKTKFILPRNDRPNTECDVEFAPWEAKVDESEFEEIAIAIVQEFEHALSLLRRGHTSQFIVFAPFISDSNWPIGTFEFGNRRIVAVDDPQAMGEQAVVLAKMVSAATVDDCLTRFQPELVTSISLLGILCGRSAKVFTRVETPRGFQKFDLPFLPHAEPVERSKLISLSQTLPTVEAAPPLKCWPSLST